MFNWNFDYCSSVSKVNFNNIPSNLDIQFNIPSNLDIQFNIPSNLDIQLVKREDPIIYYLEINDKWKKYSQFQIKERQNTTD